MKNISFSLFNVVSVVLIIVLIFLIICPFDLVNIKQAQRIAKWLNVYEKIDYSFELVKSHENSMVPDELTQDVILTEDGYADFLAPYLNLTSSEFKDLPRYKYRMMNGKRVDKSSQFYFYRFLETKNGLLVSIRERMLEITDENTPLYYMLIDINGVKKPNRIGQDIFFINIYKDKISALGNGERHAKLKTNCSPIGTGMYCSEYYLYGGSL